MKYQQLLIPMLIGVSSHVISHGLMIDPPARNAICGLAEDQKPHNATNPACIDAFANDQAGGYEFMSVLTHDVGRKGVTPLPQNVCGFDSETWDNRNNFTPWDTVTDWPATPISAGPLDIKWDIQWGPHFDDTEEFVYYITKADYVYEAGVPLKWSDFESTPFCDLAYNDMQPTANPNVTSRVGDATFTTKCDVPAREGRHVIYGEWGRNQFTFERFHGCLDVTFNESDNTSPVNQSPIAQEALINTESDQSINIELKGTDNDGTIINYTIVTQPNNGNIVLAGKNATYTPNTGFTGRDRFSFSVTDNDGASSSAAQITLNINPGDSPIPVEPEPPVNNVGPTAEFTYSANDLTVNVDATSSSDSDGPSALTYRWQFGEVATGAGQQSSYTFSTAGSYTISLTVNDGDKFNIIEKTITINSPVSTPIGDGIGDGDPSTASGSVMCDYIISNSWDKGFIASIRLTNLGTTDVDGWEISWDYTDSTQVTNSWSANLSGTGPYTASHLGWNFTIEPGKTVEIGVQGTHDGSTQVPKLTGSICK